MLEKTKSGQLKKYLEIFYYLSQILNTNIYKKLPLEEAVERVQTDEAIPANHNNYPDCHYYSG
jgi:hypothetical protein